MIQIDEPILSTGAVDPVRAGEAIGEITAHLSVPLCLHVCGDLSGVIDEVRKMPVQILDFEFAGLPANLETVSGTDIGDRLVGFGCVDSADPAVEDAAVIRTRIEKGIDLFGHERILVDPDCGLRMLSRESAKGKLLHMVEAAGQVRQGISNDA